MVASLLAIVLCGCASTQDLRQGPSPLGRGYYDIEIRPGFYRIEARSNLAMWLDYAAAQETWRQRAAALCQSTDYTELAMTESVTDFSSSSGGKHALGTVKGYALCKSSSISVREAMAIIIKK